MHNIVHNIEAWGKERQKWRTSSKRKRIAHSWICLLIFHTDDLSYFNRRMCTVNYCSNVIYLFNMNFNWTHNNTRMWIGWYKMQIEYLYISWLIYSAIQFIEFHLFIPSDFHTLSSGLVNFKYKHLQKLSQTFR